MHAGNYGVDAGWWDVWKLGAEKRALYDAGAFHITKARNNVAKRRLHDSAGYGIGHRH